MRLARRAVSDTATDLLGSQIQQGDSYYDSFVNVTDSVDVTSDYMMKIGSFDKEDHVKE